MCYYQLWSEGGALVPEPGASWSMDVSVGTEGRTKVGKELSPVSPVSI